MKKSRLMLMIVCVFVFFCLCSYVETNYTREATVISNNNNNCIVEDKAGNQWKVNLSCNVNSKVKLYMNTNNTDSNINDDTIKRIKVIKGKN